MIDGLLIVHDFVSVQEEERLLEIIGETRRIPGPERNRIERFGPGVIASGYSSGTVSPTIPPHLTILCDRMMKVPWIAWKRPNAITVNEYLVGQHLGLHADLDAAGDEILTLGLRGDADMAFQRAKDEPINVQHPRRSLMRMRWPCRYPPWRHGVLPVTADRISIVFRYGGA